MKKLRSVLFVSVGTFFAIAGAMAQQSSEPNHGTAPSTGPAFVGTVLSSGSAKITVRGAKVQLVPTNLIDMTRITGRSIFDPPFLADAYDEPLEDTIREHLSSLLTEDTNSEGQFSFSTVPDGRYFVHVTPGPGDTVHLPGGDSSRKSYSAEELRGLDMAITISSRPPAAADYVGSRTCTTCHDKKLHPDWYFNRTGHRLAWSVPGKPAKSQDFFRFPDWFDALRHWKKVWSYTEGTHLELGDHDKGRGRSSRFLIRAAGDMRVPIEKVFADVFLWHSAKDGNYYITLVNKLNPKDTEPVNISIELVYGGGVHRQRYIVSVPPSLGERLGLYTVLQYNPDGDDRRLNTDRRVWRDYKFDYWWSAGSDAEYGTDDDTIVAPAINHNTIQAECAGCHVTGAERYKDENTGQILVRGVNNISGAFDLDGNGTPDEVNVGCESCHGPGSEHANLVEPASSIQAIINPAKLSAERADVICGRCHDRRLGNTEHKTTEAINAEGKYFPPGASRHELLTEYSREKHRGPKPEKDLWPDDLHSRSPRQQYSEHIKSIHYKNDRQLVSCADCHGSHGETPFSSWLKADPEDPASPLCQGCHEVEILGHLWAKSHPMLNASVTTCISCHMPGTSRPGGDAGHYGLFVKLPPFSNAAEEARSAHWQGNLNSHVFDVPKKANIGVLGYEPNKAMPIPYTAACGVCHDVKPFQNK